MQREYAKNTLKSKLPHYLEEKGIKLNKNFNCLAGTHPDNNPSMAYDKARNKVHCFSCEADLDIIDLIERDYNVGTSEAFEIGYRKYNIIVDDYKPENNSRNTLLTPTPPKETNQIKTQIEPKKDYTELFNEARANLDKPEIQSYLSFRGITTKTAQKFNLGYIEKWRHDKAPTAPYSPRLIIPTSPHSYIARDIRAIEDIPEQSRKYTKQKAGQVQIFNLEALAQLDNVFIVEGEIDALSIEELGFNAMATGGASNTRKLIEAIKEYEKVPQIFLALDNDEAGRKAQKELADELDQEGIDFYELDTKDIFIGKKDANEALLEDKEKLKENLARYKDKNIGEIRAQEYKEKHSTAYQLQNFVDGIAKSVNTPYIPTGFSDLDSVLEGGLFEGLIILGAISSLGKTSLVLQIVDQIATQGHDVLFISLEMAQSELISKSVSRHTLLRAVTTEGLKTNDAKTSRGITTGKRYTGYSEKEQTLIANSIADYATYAEHIYIKEGLGNIGADEIRNYVKQHIEATGNAPLVVIDYLQILAPNDARSTDKQNVDKNVLELKRISRDYKIPILAISSFNRENYKSEVSMLAFKESGAIEYSSDILLGLQYEGSGEKSFSLKDARDKNPRNIELHILKNRNGRAGSVIPFKYYPYFNYFESESNEFFRI